LSNKSKFHLQKSFFLFWASSQKVIDKNQRGLARNIFFDIFKHPLWFLSITFAWRLKITKGFLEVKFRLIWKLLLVLNYSKKVVLLYLNEVWTSTLNTIPTPTTLSNELEAFIFNLSHILCHDKQWISVCNGPLHFLLPPSASQINPSLCHQISWWPTDWVWSWNLMASNEDGFNLIRFWQKNARNLD